MGGMDCCGEQSWQDAGCPNARAVVTVPVEIRRPVTADVQRELAEALDGVRVVIDSRPKDQRNGPFGGGWHGPLDNADEIAAALLPTVQALIADAEKRAAARALHAAARFIRDQRMDAPEATSMLRALTMAAALDPSGAAEGAGR